MKARAATRYVVGGAALAVLCLLAALWRGREGHARSAAGTDEPRQAAMAGTGGAARVALSRKARSRNPIRTQLVSRARIEPDIDLVGSVALDEDHYAIVGPLIAGRVVRLRARPGQRVRAGQVLAEMDSAEVGRAQADLLVAKARLGASSANLARERALAEERISSEREREVAEAQAASDAAELRAAEQRLMALGLERRAVELAGGGPAHAGRLALRSPIDGIVLQRSITVGQAVQANTDAFRIANLERLWVHLEVFEKDLEHVRAGQRVTLRTESLPGVTFAGVVAWVEPHIDDATRAARVRVELDNRGGHLRPGQFVTAHLSGGGAPVEAALTVPRSSLVTVEGRPVLFVAEQEGSWVRRNVEPGHAGGGLVEIRSGLVEGERVAAEGAFLLKSELAR